MAWGKMRDKGTFRVLQGWDGRTRRKGDTKTGAQESCRLVRAAVRDPGAWAAGGDSTDRVSGGHSKWRGGKGHERGEEGGRRLEVGACRPWRGTKKSGWRGPAPP